MDPTSPPPSPGAYIPGQTPSVIVWYKAYLIVLVLLMLLVAGIGAVLIIAPISAEDMDGMPPDLLGWIYLPMGIIFAIPFVIALFLPRKPWTWIYHIVMICIGMTGCTLVFSIPLLIFWLKPDVKGFFGRSPW